MGALLNKPTKLPPFLVAAALTYRIYACPCDKLMSCTWTSSNVLLVTLLGMTLFGWPLK